MNEQEKEPKEEQSVTNGDFEPNPENPDTSENPCPPGYRWNKIKKKCEEDPG